nr:ADP compounds hydrolase NudE [Pseudomarimonas arenosa]
MPRILSVEPIEQGGRVRAERVHLQFSNGARRVFERSAPRGFGAVIVVPMRDADTALLVREYACGLHRYELGLVKGRIDEGETVIEAANRELKEEAGFGARKLEVLRPLTMAPTYMAHQTWLVLAEDLYQEKLQGDEPEPLDVVPWRLDQLDQLMLRDDCSEGRSLAGLFIAREYLARRPNKE